eukprot:210639-Pyramimonas_sp.AAC.1
MNAHAAISSSASLTDPSVKMWYLVHSPSLGGQRSSAIRASWGRPVKSAVFRSGWGKATLLNCSVTDGMSGRLNRVRGGGS